MLRQHQEESCGGTGGGGGGGGGDCVTAWQDEQDTKKVFYSNVRSLQCEINELSYIVCDLKPDIVTGKVSPSWKQPRKIFSCR